MEIQENVSLAPLTTLKIGGAARYFARATSKQELVEAIQFARSHDLPVFILGGGSNLVVADAGFRGLVVNAVVGTAITADWVPGGAFFHVDAGVEWDAFVRHACEQGLCGVECLAGIPGLVGGSPIQNIGAYGQELSTNLHGVLALDLKTMNFVDLSHDACGFAYRRSIFNSTQRNRYIVRRVDFFFKAEAKPNLGYADLAGLRGADPTPLDVYHAVRKIRAGKGMLIDPATSGPDERSAGSFFKNPVVSARSFRDIAETTLGGAEAVPHWPADGGRVKLAAAWLIEQAGFKKGFALGKVGISSKHTLALINRTGDASCEELLRLRDLIVLTVEQRFGVTLEMEPVLLG